MRVRRTISGFVAGLVAAAAVIVAPPARAAAPVTLEAMLILASNDPSAQDPRLDQIEYKLRRTFKFEYYRHYGGQSAIVNLPGQTSLDLGHGYRLSVSASEASDDRVRAGIQWFRGDEVVLNTTVVMSRGTPVVLGGVPHEGGTLIVTLVAR